MFDIEWVGMPEEVILISKTISIISLAVVVLGWILMKHDMWKRRQKEEGE